MKVPKKLNYAKKDIEVIREIYDRFADESIRRSQVQELAVRIEKTPASIVGKIGTLDDGEGNSLWMPYSKVVSNKRGATRAELVRDLESDCGLDTGALDSLVKGNKSELVALIQSIATVTNDAFFAGTDSVSVSEISEEVK